MPASPSRRALLTAGLLAPVLSSCSALGVFNAVTPADSGARLAAEGVSYGPDPRHKLDVFVPDESAGARAAKRRPVALFIYGGSWNSGARADYAFVGRALAARGIVTVVMDYRLVPQVRYPGFVEDGALATRWVKSEIGRFGGDPARLFIMGHSAGAYSAAMLALNPAFTRDVGLRGAPYRGLVGLAGPYDFYPFDVGAAREAFGQWPRPQETQPVSIARRGAPPAFLAYGTEDTTVLPRNSRKLAEVLRSLGTRVVERAYPGVSHAGILLALSKPLRERAPVLDDVVAFIQGG
ncbi:carboxylesterase [Alsobacter metallidurans]|uniref:Carboxylesterase n=1 Tax=Alsobacter metallidurans TaxID=340221 RepID=A0A917I7S4_9HYPH|nr:alpha/beta hydrolase [Alsobacter metallidurans]GGH23525.1 carboxylesterase [Alsobacter metallidurans]